MPVIAPSLLSADFLHLERDCNMLNESEADWFHLDIMDGRFVPNISFGMPIVKQMRKTTNKFFDVHLMIVEPEKYINDFKDTGADSITVHQEACIHLNSVIAEIRHKGMKAGVAVNPHTPIDSLKDIMPFIDMVLIMSVNPGFGGQPFIEHTYQKIAECKKLCSQLSNPVLIEVDGGVSLQNAQMLVNAGADVLVAGNAIFKDVNPSEMIKKLKNIKIG